MALGAAAYQSCRVKLFLRCAGTGSCCGQEIGSLANPSKWENKFMKKLILVGLVLLSIALLALAPLTVLAESAETSTDSIPVVFCRSGGKEGQLVTPETTSIVDFNKNRMYDYVLIETTHGKDGTIQTEVGYAHTKDWTATATTNQSKLGVVFLYNVNLSCEATDAAFSSDISDEEVYLLTESFSGKINRSIWIKAATGAQAHFTAWNKALGDDPIIELDLDLTQFGVQVGKEIPLTAAVTSKKDVETLLKSQEILLTTENLITGEEVEVTLTLRNIYYFEENLSLKKIWMD